MNGRFIFVLGAVFGLSATSTVLAAHAGLFAVVPENHWSYAAVGQLAKAGIADGFGGSAYREDVILTRCEMAAIVAKAMARAGKAGSDDKAVLDRLYAEFSPELTIGSAVSADDSKVEKRLDKLEKSKSSVKLTGDARIRYQTNWNQAAKDSDRRSPTRVQQRVRLNLAADVDDNLTLLARLNATNNTNRRTLNTADKTSSTASPVFDRAELRWTNKQTTASVGRLIPSLGQGIIWDYNSIDGAMVSYNLGKAQLSAGYGDLAAYTGSGKTTNAFLANLSLKAAQNFNFTIGHLNTMSNAIAGYRFEQTALGFNTKSGKFTITGEYVKNSDSKLPANAQDHGFWGRVQWKGINNSQPGTYGISLEYLRLGNYAVDSTNNPGPLVVSGGNGIGKDGAKGYGLGAQYVFARNANLEVKYYNLKPYDSAGAEDYKNSYHLISNFRF